MNKNDILEFLQSCEGYHQMCKMLHWSTTNKSEHLLTDDIDGDVLEYQDRIAECAMGYLNSRFGIGDLKTLLPNSKTTSDLINEIEVDVLKLKKKISSGERYGGIINILDDFLEKINSWKYLRTLK